MRKLLLTSLLGLSLINMPLVGCSSSSAFRSYSEADAQDPHAQLRNQHMELYRTIEMTPQPQPIIILKPTKGPMY
ncbi:hypothetical protein MD588_21560 [Photobacterium sp. SDRW27]|uniref:hypothetical protein n=1 Tax=Photobacterium obscurum TaxID=2829490 RepID=UPI0022437EC5|nr:hypothetical protein [Photobacterium obscurum]MCW8331386.1 hypothetical protein [Photobacterium obscurum]